MKIWNLRITKKRLVGGVVATILAVCGLLFLFGQEPPPPEEPMLLETNADRLAYLAGWGWEVEEEPVETLQFLLEVPLQEPYLSYNVLQRSQGFDLEEWAGKPLYRYTYSVTNYPGGREGVQVNLYICEGLPVAGDVFCSGAEGFRNPLSYPARGNT